MKKYLLVSLTVLLAAFLWAADAVVQLPEPAVGIEGFGQVEWGVDLGSGEKAQVQHGFKNKAEWKVKFPLIKKGDFKSSKSDVPVYGEVILKAVELNIQSTHDKEDKKFIFDGKVDKLQAKFVFYGAYLTVFDKPSFKTNYADFGKPFKNDDFDEKKDKGFKFEPGFDGAGFKLGYANKDFLDLDVGIKFGSNGAWDAKGVEAEEKFKEYKLITSELYTKATTPPPGDPAAKAACTVPQGQKWISTANGTSVTAGNMVSSAGEYKVMELIGSKAAMQGKYGIGFDFAIKPLDKLLGLKFSINSTFDAAKAYANGVGAHAANQVALSVGTEISSEPIDALKFTLGFDGGYAFAANAKNAFAWDMMFKTEYKWISGGLYVASAGTPFGNKQTVLTGQNKTADMAVYLKFETKGSKKDDGKLEDSYLVEGLDAGVYLGMFNLLSKKAPNSKTQLPVLMKLWASYKATLSDSMWIKPFANIWAETNHSDNKTTKVAKLPYVGVAYDLGVTYSPVEKVEITAKWAHGKLTNNVYVRGVNQNRDGKYSVITDRKSVV